MTSNTPECCEAPYPVRYRSPEDGDCTHCVCEGDMSQFGCGEAFDGVSGEPMIEEDFLMLTERGK